MWTIMKQHSLKKAHDTCSSCALGIVVVIIIVLIIIIIVIVVVIVIIIMR